MKARLSKVCTWCALIALAILFVAVAGAATTTYTIQTGNFNAEQTRIPSGGFAGSFNQSGTEVGLYAHGGSGGTNETAFETFSTTGTTSGSARPLQIGDTFSITMFSGTNPFGFAGVYFDDNLTYTSYANYNTNERTAVVLGSSGNWKIENNGTSVDTGIGANVSLTITLAVTSSNTFNMTVNGTTYYDLVMQNTPGSTNRIQSFALALQNDRDTGTSSNFYVKDGSLTNTGSVTLGASNLSLTVSGVITDGLAAGSTSSVSSNSVTKSGTGTTTLTGDNSYTGSTSISSGVLNIQHANALGSTASGTTVTSGAALQIQGGITTAAEALTLNGSGVSGTGALRNISGSNTYSGNITIASSSSVVSDANSLTLGGTIDMQNAGGSTARTLTIGGSGDTTLAGSFINATSGTSVLAKTGSGILTITADNSASGSNPVLFNLSGGITSFSSGNAFGTPTGVNYPDKINFLDNATLQATGTTSIGQFTSSTDQTGLRVQGGKTATFEVVGSGTTLTVAGKIIDVPATGSGALTKTGAGTLILAAANSYSGVTTINNGKLQANVGSMVSVGSPINVNSGGTLLLNGSGRHIGANVNINLNGGTLDTGGFSEAGGATIGTANNIGSLTLQSSSTFDFGAGNSSVIEFGGVGAHTIGSSALAILNWTNTPVTGGAGGDRLLFDGLTTDFTTKFGQTDVSFNGQDGYTAIQLVGFSQNIYEIVGLTPIPEPGTWVAGGLTLVSLLYISRRRLSNFRLSAFRFSASSKSP